MQITPEEETPMLLMRGDLCPECNHDSLILSPGYAGSCDMPGLARCICCKECDYADEEYVDWGTWDEPVVRLTDKQKDQIAALRLEFYQAKAQALKSLKLCSADEYFEGIGFQGDFHWDEQPDDFGIPWKDDDTGNWAVSGEAKEIGREGGKRYISVMYSSCAIDGGYEPIMGYDEREGDADQEWVDSGIATNRRENLIDYFSQWGEYALCCAETGTDPLNTIISKKEEGADFWIADANLNLEFLKKQRN